MNENNNRLRQTATDKTAVSDKAATPGEEWILGGKNKGEMLLKLKNEDNTSNSVDESFEAEIIEDEIYRSATTPSYG